MTSIQPFDFHRIFLGDLPWLFTLEIVFRTVVMYVFSLMLIRVLSRRAVGQLSLIEFLLVIALGSAVGDPMFSPEVPLVHGMVVVTVVVFLNRGLEALVARNHAAELLIEGRPLPMVSRGIIDYENLESLSINRDELFQYLRLQGVEHLGMVREAYMEQSGRVSAFQFSEAEAGPGLALTPPWDLESPRLFSPGERVELGKPLGCARCGFVKGFVSGEVVSRCQLCDHEVWADRVGRKAAG